MISPTGGTHFRDALIQGCGLLIQLGELLIKTKTSEGWNFAHVVLTDGEDAGSINTFQQTLDMMRVIGQRVRIKTLKIILIGVDVS